MAAIKLTANVPCECCGKSAGTPLYLRGYFGQVVRRDLGLGANAALCDDCWRVVGWTLRKTVERYAREDDCGEDERRES